MAELEPMDDSSSKSASWLANAGRAVTRLPILVMALGVVAILIGYNGAAGYTSVAAQFPYLISGGVLGLGLIIVGTGLMISQSAREDSARVESLLAQLVDTTSDVVEHAPDDLSELLSGRSTDTGFAPKPRARAKR